METFQKLSTSSQWFDSSMLSIREDYCTLVSMDQWFYAVCRAYCHRSELVCDQIAC